ncbi:hypothetical protein [Mariprofundus ferrooxydans]|uniref:hypothetical protein n=1 Tax=Mariprofundus ferrooxydans TaxID=314344 RepID=UPI0002DE4E7C|nr:hypothetical protein [Mariprofundus ferrooxydans]
MLADDDGLKPLLGMRVPSRCAGQLVAPHEHKQRPIAEFAIVGPVRMPFLLSMLL